MLLSGPPYFEAQPHAALREAVRCVWVCAPDDGDVAPQRIAPDGCPLVIVQFGAPLLRHDDAGAALPRLLFVGQLTRPLIVQPTGAFSLLGVRFEPDGARGFIGRVMSSVTDRQIDLACAEGACAKGQRAVALFKDVTALDDWGARMDAVQHYVAAVMATNAVEIDPHLRAMVRHLEHGTHMDDPGALSLRQMQRRFTDRVGVPAQTLAAIFRFRAVLDQIAQASPELRAQTQTVRDFRRFLGCTPCEWVGRSMALPRSRGPDSVTETSPG
jgi:hypothetical protein